jgi:hypothetical protein
MFDQIFFFCVVAYSLLLLIYIAVRIINRTKYIERIRNKNPDEIKSIIEIYKKVRKTFQLFLFSSPIYLILLPIILYFFLPELLVISIVCMILVFIGALINYFYINWIINKLSM